MSIAILAAAALSGNSPIYLSCAFPSSEGPFIVNFTLDEPTGKAVMSIPSARLVETLDAAFTPNEVQFTDRHSRWAINRTTLVVSRELNFGPQPNVDHGACKVRSAPADRAF